MAEIWKKCVPPFHDWHAMKNFHVGSMHLKSGLGVNNIRKTDPDPPDTRPGYPLSDTGAMFDNISANDLFDRRRTSWQFTGTMTREQVGAVLGRALGETITTEYSGFTVKLRAYPSAGALYTVKPYVWTQHLGDALQHKIWTYCSSRQCLIPEGEASLQAISELTSTTKFRVQSFEHVNALIFFVADLKHLFNKYGRLAYRLVFLETGHMAENIQLCTNALGHKAVPIGGFYDLDVEAILNLDEGKICTYMLAIG